MNRHHNILITDVGAVGMIGVIRSLGYAGYRVHAAADNTNALGLYSRYATRAMCNPPYESSQYLAWLRDYVNDNDIEAIFPSEGFLHAIRECYQEYVHLIPDAVPREVWNRCLSKVATHEWIAERGETGHHQHLPMAGIVRCSDEYPNEQQVSKEQGPFYVKADEGLARTKSEARVVRCETAADMREALCRLLPNYEALLWQQYVPGLKVGVSLWRHEGEIWAENMTLGVHMNPWTGGMMSLRKSFWHEDLLADARAKIALLGWQGVAMMEYKWDPSSDDFWFIEINARYWGYLHLDLYSGKDFPKLQADAFFGSPSADLGPPVAQATCRHTVPGEIGYVISRLRSPMLGVLEKAGTVLEFVLRSFDPRIKSDLWYPGDRLLYLRAWGKFIRQMFR